MDENANDDNTIVIGSGSVEYALEDAACSIKDLMANLQEALNEGAEYVVLDSGNSRGARWMRLEAGYMWVGE